jgi:hypothetical protein
MRVLRTTQVAGMTFLLIVAVAGVAVARAPEGVSPGAIDRYIEVEARCPAFSWGLVPDAEGYVIIVYRLPEGMTPGELDLTRAQEVLYKLVPGAATSWTPDLAHGLEPGANYIWFVRAVFGDTREELGVADEWSHGRFFSVSAVPTVREVEEALDVLRRYAASEGEIDPRQSAGPIRQASEVAEQGDAGAPVQPSLEGAKTVATAPTAMKGHVSGASGERYGVVGITDSVTGAGLAARNTTGGPDLVLDGGGLANARVTESGINRHWGAPVSFNIHNTGGGGMTLQVDGTPVQKRVTGSCSSSYAIRSVSDTGSVTCAYDDFNIVSHTAEYSAESFNGTDQYAMVNDTGRNVCFLTRVGLRDVDGSSEDAICRVYLDTSFNPDRWVLIADTETGDDADARCTMRCIEWGVRVD